MAENSYCIENSFSRNYELPDVVNTLQDKGCLGIHSIEYSPTASDIEPAFLKEIPGYIETSFKQPTAPVQVAHSFKHLKNDPALEQAVDKLLEELLENHGVEAAIREATNNDDQFDTIAFINSLREDIFKSIKNESQLHVYLTQTESYFKTGITFFKSILSLIKSIPIVNTICNSINLFIESFNIGRRLLLTKRVKDLSHSIKKLQLETPALQELQNLSCLKLNTVADNDNRSTALKVANLVLGGVLTTLALFTIPYSPIILPILAVTVSVTSYICDLGIFAKYRPARLQTKAPHLVIKDFFYTLLEHFHKRSLRKSTAEILKTAHGQNSSLIDHLIANPHALASVGGKQLGAMADILKASGFINTYMQRKDAVKTMVDLRAQANRMDLFRNLQPTAAMEATLAHYSIAGTPDHYLNYQKLIADQLSKMTVFSSAEAVLINQICDIDVNDEKHFIGLNERERANLFFEKICSFTGKSYTGIYKMVNCIND